MNHTQENTKEKELVILTPTLAGGVGRFVSVLLDGLSKHGVSTEIWTLAGGEYEQGIASKCIKITRIGSGRALVAFIPLARLLKTQRPKVVLSISFHLNYVAILAKILTGCKMRLLVSEHTALKSALPTLPILKRHFSKMAIRILYPYASAVIAVSKYAGKEISKLSSIKSEKIHIIYNPVITHEMQHLAKTEAEHPFFDIGCPVILAVGRLSAEKDYKTLIRSFAELLKEKESRLIILGDGPERNKLETLTTELRVEDKVSLPGLSKNPYPYFAKADAFALSSKREGLPTVLIEAMYFALPIVCTDAPGGGREILEDGKYGSFVPVGDTTAMTKALTQAIDSPKQKIAPGVLDKYSQDSATKAYLSLLFDNGK